MELERNGGRPVSKFELLFELPIELEEFSALALADKAVFRFI
jgi:hypothetical protein